MRLILMYDLDFTNPKKVKSYQIFRKELIKRGFIMIQYSVYMRIVPTENRATVDLVGIKKFVPKNGNIRVFKITERQYVNMIFLRGNKRINETINTEKRYIKIDYEQESI